MPAGRTVFLFYFLYLGTKSTKTPLSESNEVPIENIVSRTDITMFEAAKKKAEEVMVGRCLKFLTFFTDGSRRSFSPYGIITAFSECTYVC